MKNKNIVKKSLSLFFSFIMLFGTACGQANAEEKGSYNKEIYQIESSGTHVAEIQKKNDYIVKNGQSDYQIVINSSDDNLWAAQQLSLYLAESTGFTMAILRDAKISDFDKDSKYIFVGDNQFLDEAGVEFDEKVLGTNGFKIESYGSNYFLGASSNRGVRYSVFEFLHYLIDFEQYSRYFTYYNVSPNVFAYDMNIVEVPDIEWRQAFANVDGLTRYTLRIHTLEELWMSESGKISYVHNSTHFLPKDEHMAEHWKWYSDTSPAGEQLCYSARGDLAEWELMVDTAFLRLKQLVLDCPDFNIVGFVCQDTTVWCACETCKAECEKYGTNSAVYLKFVNALGRKLQAWIDEGIEIDKDRDVTLCMMPYKPTAKAPAKLDEKGNYVPIDDSVKFEENVGCWYAPIDMDFTKSITSEENKESYAEFEKWTALSDKLYLWLYQTNFHHYLFPYPTWGTYQELYRYSYEKGAKLMFNQAQYNNPGTTAFNDLKTYLTAKLTWNVNLDEAELTRNYFEKVFGPAADTMRKYFDEVNTHFIYIQDEYDVTGSVYAPVDDPEYWPYPIICRWLNYFEYADDQISVYKTKNPTLYEKYHRMLVAESIFPQYVNVTHYADYYSLATKNLLRRNFVADVTLTNVKRYRESDMITSITGKWQME